MLSKFAISVLWVALIILKLLAIPALVNVSWVILLVWPIVLYVGLVILTIVGALVLALLSMLIGYLYDIVVTGAKKIKKGFIKLKSKLFKRIP